MILIVSINTLKNEYALDSSIEDKYVIPNIKKAQDFIIRPLLGDKLMDELLTQVETNTVSAYNKNLIDTYIEPIIAYFVLGETFYDISYKLKNLGLNDATDANRYRFAEVIQIADKYKTDSATYATFLKDYMCDEAITVGEDYTFDSPIWIGLTVDSVYNDLNYHTIAYRNNKPQIK